MLPDAVLVAGRSSLFVAAAQRVMSLDASSGTVRAARDIEPALGGWAKATMLPIDDDLVIVGAAGVTRLDAQGLTTKWHVGLTLDPNDTIKQLAYEPPWIAAVSNHAVRLISDRGDMMWTRELPDDARPVGSTPLASAGGRLWVGLAPVSAPGPRVLQEMSIGDGTLKAETVIDDLAMSCPALVSNGVLVLTTQGGLAGFDVRDGLQRIWSVEVPVVFEGCVAANGRIVVASRRGTLVRVDAADGRRETLVELSRTLAWVPPAPDLEPGTHTTSAGSIVHLALLPRGVGVSVSWSSARASILFRPL
jgi:outer membrane protein assembly factor BamB